MSVTRQEAIVFYAPTAGRRYFSKVAAFNAEARAQILNEYPPYPGDHVNPPEDIRFDDPEWYEKEHAKIVAKLKKDF